MNYGPDNLEPSVPPLRTVASAMVRSVDLYAPVISVMTALRLLIIG